LGKLTGITDATFGTLNGYGLYSDNVYLRGNISASSGYFSGTVSSTIGSIGGWNIADNKLYSNNITISSATNPYIGLGKTAYNTIPGIWLGNDNGAYKASFYANASNNVWWNGLNLTIQAANFQLDNSGNISASNATLGGYIAANTGYIGGSSGWVIDTNKITTSGM